MTIPARPIPESYWVVPGRFLAGEYPGHFDAEIMRRRMDAFLTAGFDTFIDLTHPDELQPYFPVLEERATIYGLDITHHRFSILDRGLPSRAQMIAALDAIDSALGAGRKVYLHCWGGVGRTGTTVGCYLVRHGQTGEQALRQIAEWRQGDPRRQIYPRSPETDEQVQFILDWHESSPSTPTPLPKLGEGSNNELA